MILKKLSIKNFRNYTGHIFNFNNKFNFIYGENGQGKTNILEAISYSALGKSFLGSAESDCVMFGKDEFRIESEFENDMENKDLVSVNYNKASGTKSVHKNKEKVTVFSSEIFGRFPLVVLSPQSLVVTYGNPSDRRRFFDILISQSSRLYLDYLKELAKIIRQKNALFKSYSFFKKYSHAEMTNLLDSYNDKLADVSANIVFKRMNFLKEFRKYFEKSFSFLNSSDQLSSIGYYSDVSGVINPGEEPEDFTVLKKSIGDYISAKTGDEISRSTTLAGPQRDDYIFKLNKTNSAGTETFELKHFASQGEHKTFVVALKLAEYEYLKDRKSTNPVLLLDDVLSELDESRVSRIISHLKDYGQIFLTTTEIGYTDNLKEFYQDNEISVFKIENGAVAN